MVLVARTGQLSNLVARDLALFSGSILVLNAKKGKC
jgi:hypothetical protein